jgi:hypothetical protein
LRKRLNDHAGAHAREGREAVALAERREAVAAHHAGEEELVVQVGRGLAVVRRDALRRPELRRHVRQRVLQVERLGRDERRALHEVLAVPALVEVLAERERASEVAVELAARRRAELVVDLQLRQRERGHLPVGAPRRRERQRLAAVLGVVVGAEHVVDVQPVERPVVEPDVADHPPELVAVARVVEREERVVVPAADRLARGARVGPAERPVQPALRVDVLPVVEVGRRAQGAQQQPRRVRPLLDLGAGLVDVADVPLDREVAEDLLRRAEADRVRVQEVVRPHQHAALARRPARDEELRAVAPAGDLELVVERVARWCRPDRSGRTSAARPGRSGPHAPAEPMPTKQSIGAVSPKHVGAVPALPRPNDSCRMSLS